jgi:2,3-dihydroxybiphenyl 1,2-dioxygenase
MDQAAVRRLGYLGIGVSDIAGWEWLATEILGLVVSGRSDDGTIFLREDNLHHRIALHPSGEDDVAYIGWEVGGDRDMAGLATALTEVGIEITRASASEASERGVIELIHLADPDGIRHEVYYGLANIGELFVPDALEGRFRTGALGMGHYTAHVSDHDRHVAFYRDGLGMRRTSTRRLPDGSPVEGVSSWRCNPRHHSVALVAMRQRPEKWLSHFGLHLNDIDDVGIAYDKALDAGIVDVTLGRHQGDQMLSFYLRTPSGFQVEFGWQGREIHDDASVDQVVGPPSRWGHRPVTSREADVAVFSQAKGLSTAHSDA